MRRRFCALELGAKHRFAATPAPSELRSLGSRFAGDAPGGDAVATFAEACTAACAVG